MTSIGRLGVPAAVFALAAATLGVVVEAQPRAAEAPRALTAADYARAEKRMSYNVTPLVFHSGVRPGWVAGSERFWYRNTLPEGSEFILVDPAQKTRRPAFDHARMAAALSAAAGTTYDALHLPFMQFDLSADGRQVSFDARGRRFTCDLQGEKCAAAEEGPGTPPGRGGRGGGRREVRSPDGKRAAFIRDWNLWVRDVATGKETPLTKDGVKDFGYATDNAGWSRSDRPVLLWSPDSKKIATFQQDQREVGEMYVVETRAGHPTLQAWKYPLPGDETVTMIQRVVIEVDPVRVVRLPDAARPAPLLALRRPGLPGRVERRGVERGRQPSGLHLHLAGPPARAASAGRGRHRHGTGRAGGERPHVLRIGQRPRQLALPLRHHRGHLVLGEERLGPSLSI